jgi:hypothetical protein
MVSQSLITQKISELIVEAQTGVKRSKLIRPSDAIVVDSVTISEEASIIQTARIPSALHMSTQSKAKWRAAGMLFRKKWRRK